MKIGRILAAVAVLVVLAAATFWYMSQQNGGSMPSVPAMHQAPPPTSPYGDFKVP